MKEWTALQSIQMSDWVEGVWWATRPDLAEVSQWNAVVCKRDTEGEVV